MHHHYYTTSYRSFGPRYKNYHHYNPANLVRNETRGCKLHCQGSSYVPVCKRAMCMHTNMQVTSEPGSDMQCQTKFTQTLRPHRRRGGRKSAMCMHVDTAIKHKSAAAKSRRPAKRNAGVLGYQKACWAVDHSMQHVTF